MGSGTSIPGGSRGSFLGKRCVTVFSIGSQLLRDCRSRVHAEGPRNKPLLIMAKLEFKFGFAEASKERAVEKVALYIAGECLSSHYHMRPPHTRTHICTHQSKGPRSYEGLSCIIRAYSTRGVQISEQSQSLDTKSGRLDAQCGSVRAHVTRHASLFLAPEPKASKPTLSTTTSSALGKLRREERSRLGGPGHDPEHLTPHGPGDPKHGAAWIVQMAQM